MKAARRPKRRGVSRAIRRWCTGLVRGDVPVIALALPVCLNVAPGVAGTAQVAANEKPSAVSAASAAPAPHGFYLGFGLVREYLRLSLDDRAVLPDRGIEMEEWGSGAAFTFGYQWSPRFRGEIALAGTAHQAHPEGATAGSAVARFTGYVPLVTGKVWEPHLIGGLSGWASVFRPKGGKELAYLGVTGDAGFGLRVHLGRHWSLQADYLHAAIDVDQEIADREGDQNDMLQVGHRGRAEVLRLGCLYDF